MQLSFISSFEYFYFVHCRAALTFCPSNIFIRILIEGKVKFYSEVRSK